MSFKDTFLELVGWGPKSPLSEIKAIIPEIPQNPNPTAKRTSPPAGRVSSSEYEQESFGIRVGDNFHKPEFDLGLIRIIRSLSKRNADLGGVYNDLIQLTNTGHEITFDQSIDSKVAEKMKTHLLEKSATWGNGVSGIDGFVNKLIGQIWVSGALSAEWVPQQDLNGIANAVLVNPENIRFTYDAPTTRYKAFQEVSNKMLKDLLNNVIELNPNTYFYNGILGDTDSPYGIPPFLTALEALGVQKEMNKNIANIMRQLGLLGYLEVKIDKPDQMAAESVPAYEARLDRLLVESKSNVIKGFSDGVVTGYEGDHEFEFHATTKNLSGVGNIYNQNEVNVANGLKVSPSMIGQKANGTETNMSIVFTKMLSQLKNVQAMAKAFLLMGYVLELQLAGYKVKKSEININFRQSTITDDFKTMQALEIKQRVYHNLVVDGIIKQDTYAQAMGFNKAHSEEPIVSYEDQLKVPTETPDGESGDKDKASKNKSAKSTREKKKDQPRQKGQKS